MIDQHDVNMYREIAGGVTTINVLHGSCNAIGGQNAVLKMRWGKTAPGDLVMKEAPRGHQVRAGREPQALQLQRARPAALPGHAHGRGSAHPQVVRGREGVQARVGGLRPEAEGRGRQGREARAPRKDLRLEELVDVLDGKVLVHAHCYRSDEILMLIRVADDMGFKIRTFQHVLEGYKVAREIAKHGAGASTFSDWWAYKLEAFDAIPYNAAVMTSKGVNVSLNSDSDELARRLYWEAGKVMKYGGMTEEQALKMITANPAWQLGDRQAGRDPGGGQGRRHRHLQRASLLAGGARGDDPRGRDGGVRPGARPVRARAAPAGAGQ